MAPVYHATFNQLNTQRADQRELHNAIDLRTSRIAGRVNAKLAKQLSVETLKPEEIYAVGTAKFEKCGIHGIETHHFPVIFATTENAITPNLLRSELYDKIFKPEAGQPSTQFLRMYVIVHDKVQTADVAVRTVNGSLQVNHIIQTMFAATRYVDEIKFLKESTAKLDLLTWFEHYFRIINNFWDSNVNNAMAFPNQVMNFPFGPTKEAILESIHFPPLSGNMVHILHDNKGLSQSPQGQLADALGGRFTPGQVVTIPERPVVAPLRVDTTFPADVKRHHMEYYLDLLTTAERALNA